MQVVGYRLNRLDEPVLMAGPKPILTEFGIHYRLEICVRLHLDFLNFFCMAGFPEERRLFDHDLTDAISHHEPRHHAG